MAQNKSKPAAPKPAAAKDVCSCNMKNSKQGECKCSKSSGCPCPKKSK